MVVGLARNWWALGLRGLCAIIFGLLAIAWPGITIEALVLLYGAYALVDGVFGVIAAFMGVAHGGRWWLLLLSGLAGIAVGVITFVMPGITAVVLLYFVAAWSIVTGILQIVAAIELRKVIQGEFWLGLTGLISVLFGVFLLVNPLEGLVVIAYVIGFYAVFLGIMLLGLAFRLRSWHQRSAPPGGTVVTP